MHASRFRELFRDCISEGKRSVPEIFPKISPIFRWNELGIERKDCAFKEIKKMTVPRNVFEILCLRKCENLRSTLFRVYCTLTCYTREEGAVCLSSRVTGVKLLGKAHLPWNICLSALQKFV